MAIFLFLIQSAHEWKLMNAVNVMDLQHEKKKYQGANSQFHHKWLAGPLVSFSHGLTPCTHELDNNDMQIHLVLRFVVVVLVVVMVGFSFAMILNGEMFIWTIPTYYHVQMLFSVAWHAPHLRIHFPSCNDIHNFLNIWKMSHSSKD